MTQTCIAVVDDDLDDLLLLTDSISKFDPSFDCRVFYTPEDVIESLIDQRDLLPQCIFIDMNMPRISGIELVRTLRSYTFLNDVKVIVLSTYFAPDQLENILSLGANFGFLKPTSEIGYEEMFSAVFRSDAESETEARADRI